jgi:L-lactate dehydrogenase complex protein LldE
VPPDGEDQTGADRSVALFVTCVADVVTPDVVVAAVRVLRAGGCAVSCPPGQTCCGQPAWNAGFVEEAARVARTSLAALDADRADHVVVPAGSCATMIRLYWPDLFERVGDQAAAEQARAVGARVREFTELTASLDLPELGAVEPHVVAYHRSCHMERELGIQDQPRELLDRVPACERLDWEADDRCCGFGGTFSVKLPEASVAMADEKLDTLPPGVTEVVGADMSCLLQLQSRAEARGVPVTVRHVAEILAEALEAADDG